MRGVKVSKDPDELVKHVGQLSSAICKFIKKYEEALKPKKEDIILRVRETGKKVIDAELRDL